MNIHSMNGSWKHCICHVVLIMTYMFCHFNSIHKNSSLVASWVCKGLNAHFRVLVDVVGHLGTAHVQFFKYYEITCTTWLMYRLHGILYREAISDATMLMLIGFMCISLVTLQYGYYAFHNHALIYVSWRTKSFIKEPL